MHRPPGFRGTWRDDDDARAVYAEAAGIARAIPAAVAVPADGDDVSALAEWAHASRTALIPRGSGSSMAGGAVGRGVIVDLSRLHAIGDVDRLTRRVWVGPGAVLADVNARAARAGLRFPVEPSSGAFCTLGGMASTNASGARSLRYGSARRWITALDCVFADGTRALVRRGDRLPTRIPAIERFVADVAPDVRAETAHRSLVHWGVHKDSSGYALGEYARTGELVDLLVGSEGTLAILVGLELALDPIPAATSSVLASFMTLEQAADAAGRARETGASACELLDRTFLDIAMQGDAALPVPANVEAALIAEVEAPSEAEAKDGAQHIRRAFLAAGAYEVTVALAPPAEEQLWALRHAASPTLARLDPSLKSMQFIEDGAVPPGRLPDYVRGVRAALAAAGVRGVIFGHAGDAHVHVNPLIDVRDPDWRRRLDGVLDQVTALVRRLGGTVSGEHGDGRLRTPLLDQVWSTDARALFARTKAAFDPEGILNPGVKVPLPGQLPVTEVKYDPALPPLPAPARAALERVERDRAYASFRLALLDEAAERA